jgi:DNA ligase (NAD+)
MVGRGSVVHWAPMLSLDACRTAEELREFDRRICARLAIDELDYVVEPKLDGIAVQLTYAGGAIYDGATRGDGSIGEDVTENLLTIQSLPVHLRTDDPSSVSGDIIVRGEVVMGPQEFEALNQRLKDPYVSARCAAAATLRSCDPSIAAERTLQFYAYDIAAPGPRTPVSQLDVRRTLEDWGFQVEQNARLCPGIEPALDWFATLQELHGLLGYDCDGMVVKVNDRLLQARLGAGPRAPRWAAALKFPPPAEAVR